MTASRNPLTPISTRLGIPDGDPDTLTDAILHAIERLQNEADPDRHHPDDTDEIARLKLQLRSRAIPADHHNPDDVTEIERLKKQIADEKAEENAWAIPRYILAAGFLLLMVFALLAKLWLGAFVGLAVAAAIVVNIRSNKNWVEMLAEMLGYGALLAYLLYCLASPATPAWVWASAEVRPPADAAAQSKSEGDKLKDIVSGTKPGQPIDFPQSLYESIERKGNVIRVKKLVGVDANYALLTSKTTAVAIKEGAQNVAVDGEYLVYTSPADPASYRIYLDPTDTAKLPSASRQLPASK